MIARGTTPHVKITLPFDSSILDVAYISISQDDNVIIEKTLYDCIQDGNTLTVKLTQEDTLKLSSEARAEIQIRARDNDGNAIVSNIKTTYIYKINKDGVI